MDVDWNKYAEQYDEIVNSGKNPAYDTLTKKLHLHIHTVIRPGDIITDNACGTGNHSIPLAKHYPNTTFVLIDSAPKMLEQAEYKARSLPNVIIREQDVESAPQWVTQHHGPINHSFMIHALYATRSKEDPQKPQRVLDSIASQLESGGTFFIADIQRPLRTNNWIPYCLFHAYAQTHSIAETMRFFKRTNQGKAANHFIDKRQKEGHYLLSSLDEFVNMIESTGLSVLEKNDSYYRERDNLVIAKKYSQTQTYTQDDL